VSVKKTAEQKRLEGNRGKRRIAPESVLELGAPDPPASMKGEALQHWRYLCDIMLSMRTLTKAHMGILIIACNTYAQMMQLERAIARKKSLVYRQTGSMGQPVEKRVMEFDLLTALRKDYRRCLVELGLTPISSHRAKVMPQATKDGVGEFFS
jgi:phage terminase small subunit